MKRVVSLILCFCILFSSVTSAQAIVLPRAIREIQAEAFMGDTSITGVLDLSGYENLDSIGDRAFKDTGITGINWGSNTVSRIGAGAFENTDITGIVMAGGEVGDRAFAGTDVFAADFYGGVYGDGVLRDSGATYAVFESDDVELADGAFVNTETGEKDVLALVGPNGGTVEAYAAAKGIPYYSMESTRLVYDDQFVVEIDNTDYTARAILPLFPVVQGGTFPEAFSNGEVDYPITEIGPHTFSGVEIADGGTIVIPVGIQLPAEEERVNWPENIVVADIDLSNVQVQAQINGCAGKDYNDWYTGQYYEFHMDEGYTEDWIDFGYCFVDSDLTAAEQQVVASMIETTVIIHDRWGNDDEHVENVVRINADGRIVAVSEGEVDITYIVSLNGVELSRARATARVFGLVPMNVPSAQLSIGEQIRLYPIVNLSDLDPLSIHYYSEDDSVADVDPETGVVTAKRPGSTKIIAEAYCYIYQKNVGDHHRICTAECVITVVDGAFNADQTNLSLYGGESCDIAFINNTDKVITDITWESSNAGAVFAKVHEDRTGATITTENGYAYPGHDRITFTATFEDGTTASVTVHVAGEAQLVYAEAEWPYYQFYTGDEPMEFQYFTYYAPGYSAENIHVYYDVEVLESNTEGAELVTVDEDGYMYVTEDASVTGVANVYAIFVHADTGRTVARIKSGVIVNQGIPAIDAETAGFAFDQETFYLNTNDDVEVYPFRVRVADDDIWNYYWAKYEVISEDDGNPDTEDDTGLVLGLYDDGCWEYFNPGTAVIRATLVPHNEAEMDPSAEPVTAEATVVIDDALPYLTYGTRWTDDDSGYVEEGWLDPNDKNYFYHGEINTVKLQGLPEGIGVERTEWHINEKYFSILGQDETSFSFSVIDWTQEDETLDVRVFLENGSEFFLSYPLRGCGLGDYNGIYLDPPAVTLSVGDVFTVEAYKEVWDQNNYEYNNDYNFYDPIWIDFYDQDVVEPFGGKLIDDRMPASVDESGDEGEYEYIGLYETRQLRAVKAGETVVTVYGLFTETDGNGGEQMYQDQMDLYVNVVEPEMTLEAFDPVSVMFVGSEYDPSVAVSHNGLDVDLTFSFSEEGILEMDYENWKLIPVGEGTVDVTVTATKGDLEPQSLTATVTVYGTDLFFAEGTRLSMPAGAGGRILHIENNTGKEIDHVAWTTSDENVVMFYNEENGYAESYYETQDGRVDVDTMTDEIGARAEISATVYFTDGMTKNITAMATVREMAVIHNDSVELVPNETFGLDWEFDGWMPDHMDFIVDNPDVVSVSAQGVITALVPGYAQVFLYAVNDSTWLEVSVPVEVRNFAANLVPDELNLSMGEAAYLVPQFSLEEGYWIDDQRTRFWSMDESVATVDHMGLVTAVAPGSTTIGYETRTFYDDYPLVAYATVNVFAEESGVLDISDGYVELTARARHQLGVTVNDNYIEEKAIESIEWVSSDEGWLSVDDTGLLYAFNWDIEEPRTVFVTANVTFTDGTTDSMICSVKLLPALISVTNCPNFYEIGVEESVPFEYAISMNQAAWDIDYDVLFSVEDVSDADKPEDERATIVTVDKDGIMTGVAPGVALVRMDVMEVIGTDEDGAHIYGRNLFTGAAYVYVDTPIPEPTEDSIAFKFGHYYLSLDHHGGNHAHIVDENGLGQFHNMVFTSDNERVVTINNGGWMEPRGNGTTTIHAWFEGYEEYAISARVTVGTPELSYEGVAWWNEHGHPVVHVGDVLTVKIENMPPFGNMREDQIQPNHINLNVDGSMLREFSRDDEENTISFLAVGEGWMDGSIEVNVNNDRNFDMWMGVQVDGSEAEFTMDERALVMAEGEIVQLWPHYDWEEDWAELISFSSDNEDVLTITEGTRCLLLKGEAQGTATVTAQYRLNDERVITTTTSVAVGPYYWNVSFDNIPSVLYAGERYNPWPSMDRGTYYEPEHGNWHISDESVAGIEEHDDDVWLVARQPGEFTLSMTFSMDNPGFDFAEQTTVMKTITVVERPYSYIEFAENEVEVRPGESFFVPLHINTDWQIRNVQYWSEDEGLVTVRNMLDDPSYPEEFPDYDYNRHGEAVIITGVKANNSTRVFAMAEFDILGEVRDEEGNILYEQATDEAGNPVFDGEGNPVNVPVMEVVDTHTAYASMRVKPIEDDNVYLNIHGFDGMGDNPVRVTNQYWGDDSGEALVWLNYETNAAVYGNGEDILTLNWSVDDPNVASICDEEGNVRIEGYGVPQNGLWITGLNPGGTALRLNALIWRHVYDEDGNVQYNEDGSPVMNVLCEENWERWIEVEEPNLHVWFNNPNNWDGETPVYELHGTDNRCGLSWQIDEYRAMYPLTEKVWVDDTSVATVSANGELLSVAPGETRVRVQVITANGHCVENEAIVRVYGNEGDMGRVEVGFYDGQITIAAGESAALPYYLFDNGYQIHNQWWSTSDETVATVSKDGVVYGVGRGYAVITSHVDTEYGWQEAQCMVEVTGTSMGAWFAEDMLVLHRGSEATVGLRADGTIDANGGDPIVIVKSLITSNEDVLKAEVVTDENGRYLLNEEGQPVIHLTATDWDNAKTYYITVTAVVEDYNGELQTATMLVIVPEQRLRIAGHQFGEGRWEHLGLHDWNNPLTIREQYITSDPDMHVEVEVTVDMAHDYDEDGRIIRTYPVIVWDPECGGYIGVNVGETTMHYTVTADSGESYTADLKVFVGGEDRMPDELKLREGCEYIVTALGDNNRWVHEVIDWPEYKGCDLAYEVTAQQLFSASEGSVLSIGEDGLICTENAGVATVRIYCPHDESLSTQVRVLVFNPNDVVLTRVDECEDPSVVKTGETVHLGFHNAEGGAVIWDELGIHAETRQMRGNDEYWITSEDGLTFTCYFWDGEFGHEVGVRFPDGYEWNTDYRFTMDKEGFFRVRLNNYPMEAEFVGNPMERSDGGLGWDSTIEEDYHVFWESENTEIAFVNADGSIQLSGDVTFTEENPSVSTNIIGIARRWVGEGERDFDNLDAWEEIARDSFPVRIIEPTAPNFDINTNGVQTVVVGDKLHMWISEYDEKTNAPTHWFTSSDENKLQFTGNYGEFLALAPGKVTITCEASNGFTAEAIAATTVKKTITIYVVEAEPKIWLPGVDMRPGQTFTLPVGFDENGSGISIASVAAELEDPIADVTVNDENALVITNARFLSLDSDDGSSHLIQDSQLTTTITLSDGTVHKCTSNIHVIADEEVWFEPWHDEIWLSTESWGIHPVKSVVWQSWHHNAAFFDEENPGTDEAWIEWSIDDESIAQFTGEMFVREDGTTAPWNNGPMVKAVSEGETVIRTKLWVKNAEGEVLIPHDKHGNPYTDDEGHVLDYVTDEIPVYVHVPSVDFGFNKHELQMTVGERRHVGITENIQHAAAAESVTFTSSNPAVAAMDVNNHIIAYAPGETTITMTMNIRGEMFTDELRVAVEGVDAKLSETEITIERGGYAKLDLLVTGDYQAHNVWFESLDHGIATVNNDGYVYGVETGATAVICYVEHDYGTLELPCVVHVAGTEDDDLVLSTHYAEISAFGEQMISYEYTGEGTPVSVRWHSTNEDYLFVAPITSGGQMTNRAMLIGYGGEIARDHYVTLYCFLTVEKTAEDGSTYTEEEMDVCLVKVNKAGILIANHQFGPGQWGYFKIGETEGIWERYIVTDQTFSRIETFVSIERGGENVAVYDEAERVIRAVGQGRTNAFFTVNGYKLDGEGNEYLAETCSDRRVICVEVGGAPDVQYAKYEPQVVEFNDREGHLQIVSEPDYTGCYTTFISRNPEIITFDNPGDARFTIHGTGMAEVDVVCPDFEHLNFTARVMVMDMDVLKLARVDVEEGEDPYIVRPYETVQLGFWQEYTDENGSVTNVEAPLWEQYGIPVRFEPHRNYDPNRLYVTEDLQLTTTWTDFNEEIHHWVSVVFGEGENEQRFDVCYPFHIVKEENFFRAVLQDDDRAIELVMNPGDRFCMDYRTNIEWQDNYSVEYYIGWDEYGNEYDNLAIYNGNEVYARYNGEGMVYARLVEEIPDENGDGAFFYTIAEDSFPVRVIDPQVPVISIDVEHGNTVRLGDTVQLHLAHENENTFAPYHEYFSMNEEILEQVVDGEGNPVNGLFRAVGLGTTQIKAEGYYGYPSQGCWAETSAFFSVIPGNASVSFEQDYVEMRPGQTMILPVHFNANGSDGELSGYTVSVTDDNIISAEMIEQDGTDAVRVTRLAVSGDAQVNVQAMLADGSTRGASCTIGVASDIYLNMPDQTIFLYTDEVDGPTEAEVYLTWETNAAFAGDENPGTDTLWIDWSSASANIAVSDDIGADTATNNGVHVTAVAQGLTSFTGYVTVKDVYGTVIAEGEAKVSVYVCNDNVDISLVNAPDATEYVGNVGDAVQIRWNTDQWSSEEGLPEGYSVLYKEVDQYGIGTGVVTVDQYGWFYPQMEGETNIQVRVRESYVNETSGNTVYRVVAAGTFPVRVIEPETPNITVTADRDALTVGELVQFSISYDNSNTFAPWYYIEVDETILDPVYNEEDDEIFGLYKVFDTNEDAQTTVTVYANYGTSAENAQSEVSITLPIQAGMPVIEMPMMSGDMRPGQVLVTPVYFNDNASGIGMESWSAASSDTEIVTVERTELDGEDALRVSCLSDARDAVVTVTVVLDNGETVTFDYDVCPISNSEVWVEADDRYIRMNDAAFGEEGHERWLYVGFGTNAAVAGDPNRDGTDYAKITDWHVVNPDGVTVVSIGEPEGEDGNSVYVRAENVGTAYVYATVELYDAADNFLAKDTAEFEIEVSEATMNVWFDSGAYGFNVGQRNYIKVNRSTYAPADQVIYESSDESVFTVDIWGNLMMQGPGTATYTVTYIYGDKSFSASTQIEVYGPKVQMHANELTLAVGESATIPHTVEKNGYSIHVLSWTSSDENVASVTPDGKVYAVAPGVAMVTLYAGFDWGDVEYVCTVTVTGEEEAGLALSERAMTLYRTNSAQLEVEYTGEGTLDEGSISWYSSDSDVVSVDNGVLYAPWRDNAMDSDTVFILCQAQVNMGTEEEPVWEMVTDECYVHVPAPSVYSNNMTFGEGMWYNLEIGDTLYNQEGYFVNDSSIVVETSIRVDNTDVAVYDAENGWFRAVGAGVTTAYYTMTVYRTDENGELQPTGETYTVTADLVVEQNTEPSEVRGLYAPYVVDLSWQWEYLPLEFVPQEGEQYADCYVEFESLNPEVLTFSYPYNSEMTLHSEGLATVQITCPDYPHLNTTAQVLVFDSNTLQLVAADESNPYSVRPYQETQLSFRTVSWDDDYNTIYMPPVWEREGVEVTYYPYNEDEARNITDDLKLTVFYTGGNVYQSVEVEFNGGQRLHLGSHLSVNSWDPYFIAMCNGQTEAVGVIGGSGWVGCTDNLWQHYGDYTFTYESSDTSVVTVDENGWMEFLSYGDAVITMTATINGGEITMESTLPVYVRNPETPDCWIDASTHAVKLGESIELNIGYENGFTNAPDHSYTSLNPEILEQAYDEYGNLMFGCFRAVGIGEAVIQLDASYGTGEDRLSATVQDTFYVIAGDPQLQFNTEATGLRVGQTLAMPVVFNDNGSGATLAEDPEYTFWVDYGESVTVTDTILEDGRYAVLVTANDPYNSPNINVKAKLSDGSEVYGSKWLSMFTDDGVYMNINHDGQSSACISNLEGGNYPTSAQFRVLVDTNADIGGIDTLKITWRADDDSFIQLDESQTDEYGNGIIVRTTGHGYTNLYADVELTLASGVIRTDCISFWVVGVDEYYLYTDYGEKQWYGLTDKVYGSYPMSDQVFVDVDTNANLSGGDTLEITWSVDDASILELDDSQVDEYGNGIIIRRLGGGTTYLHAYIKLTRASGMIYEQYVSYWVNCYTAYCDIQFSQDAYNMIVGDGYYLDIYPQTSNTMQIEKKMVYVDNESVAHIGDQYIYADAPGTANLICRVVFTNGEYVEHSVPVTVQGATMAWADGTDEPVIVRMGDEPIRLATAVEWHPEGIGYANGGYWYSSDYSVVNIDEETGDITAVAPGMAVVTFIQYIMYESGYSGEVEVCRTIIVPDENAPVTMSETEITLSGESRHQLTVNVHDDSHGEVTNISWHAANYASVDENGVVQVSNLSFVRYGKVSATVTFADGYQYTVYCVVKVNTRQFSPASQQFYDGAWTSLSYDSMYAFRDAYDVYSDNVTVEMTFESSDESIATVDENGNIYSHDKAGDADITMTMKGYVDGVYTGESYVRKFRVRVEVDTTPSWMEYGNNETWVIPLNWNTYYLPYSVEPYTSWSYTMTTDNPDVAYFPYEGSMQIQLAGTGEANLTMTIQDTELTDTAKIIVIDPNQLSITAEDGRTVFGEGEEVQLVINGLGAVESEVSTICWYESDYNDSYGVDSDGILMTESDYGDNGQSSVWADVIFNCGTSIAVPSFYFDIVL